MSQPVDDFFGISEVPSVDNRAPDGYVRAHGVITKEVNEKIKLVARKRGIHASQVTGELIMKAAAQLDHFLIKEKALELQNELGEDWLDLLKSFSNF